MLDLNDVAVPRLFTYRRALAAAAAALLGHGISSTQIRKDLSALGPLGRRGQGYAIKPLLEQLGLVLGLGRDRRMAIAGFGYLGHAFAAFVAAREEHFKVAAIFDRSPAVIGQTWQDIPVHDIDDLEAVLADADCNIGVLAVPAASAQSVADRLAACGVRALSILTHRLTLRERAELGYTG